MFQPSLRNDFGWRALIPALKGRAKFKPTATRRRLRAESDSSKLLGQSRCVRSISQHHLRMDELERLIVDSDSSQLPKRVTQTHSLSRGPDCLFKLQVQ